MAASVPLGGSHFTKALSKELRLTFAKAEHLKRNAMQAQDRGRVPGDAAGVQRPVDGSSTIDRLLLEHRHAAATIGRVVALGNATKLPGLQKYLAQNLGYPVVEVEKYRGLSGSGVVASPIFKENLLSFAVCYGLALQGLGRAKLSTNLLPREILTDRLIRDKKPWGVGVAAALMLGFTLSILGYWRAWNSVDQTKFSTAIKQADAVKKEADDFTSTYGTKEAEFKQFDQMGKNIVGNVEGRLMWIEVLKALDSCLPTDELESGQTARPIWRTLDKISRFPSVRNCTSRNWIANTVLIWAPGISRCKRRSRKPRSASRTRPQWPVPRQPALRPREECHPGARRCHLVEFLCRQAIPTAAPRQARRPRGRPARAG